MCKTPCASSFLLSEEGCGSRSQLLLETDAPYMRPDPAYCPPGLPGKRKMEPCGMAGVCRAVAECLGQDQAPQPTSYWHYRRRVSVSGRFSAKRMLNGQSQWHDQLLQTLFGIQAVLDTRSPASSGTAREKECGARQDPAVVAKQTTRNAEAFFRRTWTD